MWCQGCEWKDFESTHHLAAVVRSIKCAQVDCTLHFPEHVSSAEGPDPCELAQNPRYRKGPDVCFDSNENVSSFVPETALWWSFTVGLRQLLPAFHLHESNHCELFSFWYVDTCVDFINISFLFHFACNYLCLSLIKSFHSSFIWSLCIHPPAAVRLRMSPCVRSAEGLHGDTHLSPCFCCSAVGQCHHELFVISTS